jgi:uncharacterized protein
MIFSNYKQSKVMKKWITRLWMLFVFAISISQSSGQDKALVNTNKSSFVKLHAVDMGQVQWTRGFWAERFRTCRDSMVPNLWRIYNDASISHAFKNFEIAAGLDTGSHKGPSFHDGDYYKTLEAMASLYAITRDSKLDAMMDKAIEVIAKSQRDDGYIYSKAMIDQRKTGVRNQFEDRLSFEAYNIGHLMTAACVHYRATGKRNLLDVAKKATEYLYNFYQKASPALARNAICPSHYMGVVEMYRTTGEPRYLELAKHLIDIKGKIEDGTDDNQDRVPFREQFKAMGHAVRANYLYAGVADLYAETGDTSLFNRITSIWNDLVQHKMYVTGGCGSLYDGVSPDGTVYNPSYVQKVHQAYGRDFQLPNFTAHNETCANIGNVLWNWRMLLLTGDAKYADVMELALYNSVLSGISLNGKNFLYTNPLAFSDDLPFQQRWSKDRVPYISLSNCCPPNVVRTVAEVSNYAYSLSDKGVWVNLYGGSTLSAALPDGTPIVLVQETNYPWDGMVNIHFSEGGSYSLFLRIPGWSKSAELKINGKAYAGKIVPGEYVEIKKNWIKGDKVQLNIPMPVVLMEANPLVEETRNQVAVKRGPVVYCMESNDVPKEQSITALAIASKTDLKPVTRTIANNTIVLLEGKAKLVQQKNWNGQLYREISSQPAVDVPIRLIPYFAWGNRGHSEMYVWLPLIRK